jgi:hypothetical protein
VNEARAGGVGPRQPRTSVRTRLTLSFSLLALVAVVASALVTLHVGARGAEAEASRRLTTAASFATTLIMAERDRNRIDALEVASRLTIQQALVTRDTTTMARQLAGLRQILRDDLLAVYTADGALLAGDMIPELRLDEPVGLVNGALGGTTSAATILLAGHLVVAAAAPVTTNNEIIGAVFAADMLDERYARRLGAVTEMMVALATETGQSVATEPVSGPLLSAEQWTMLRGRGDMRYTVTATAQRQRGLARPLLGADGRPVGAMIVAMPESYLTPIEEGDLPLYLALSGGVLVSLWGIGALVAWGIARRVPREPPAPGALAPLRPGSNGATPDGDVRRLSGLVVDRVRHRVEVDGREVALTPTEFALLWVLAAAPGQVVTREALLEQLRGADWQAEPGLLDTHVSNLRRKIEPDPAKPRYVLTVRGIGYKLADL